MVPGGHAGWPSRLPAVLARPGGHTEAWGAACQCMQGDASCRGHAAGAGDSTCWRTTSPLAEAVSLARVPFCPGKACPSLNAADRNSLPGLGTL